jgi:hypothetical protein
MISMKEILNQTVHIKRRDLIKMSRDLAEAASVIDEYKEMTEFGEYAYDLVWEAVGQLDEIIVKDVPRGRRWRMWKANLAEPRPKRTKRPRKK